MKIDFHVLLERLFKLVGVGLVLSLLSCYMMSHNGGKYETTVYVTLIINVIYFAWLVRQFLIFRIGVPGKARYFKYNGLAMGFYCGLAIILAVVLHFLRDYEHYYFLSQVYTYIFFLFKSPHYYTYNLDFSFGVAGSAVCYSAICYLIMFAAPLFINKSKVLEQVPDVEVVSEHSAHSRTDSDK